MTDERRAFVRKLRGEDFDDDAIDRLRIGFVDAERDHYLLPVTEFGRVVDVIEWHPNGKPKYRFSAGEKRPLIGKENLARTGTVVVVEGWFDWAAVEIAGH